MTTTSPAHPDTGVPLNWTRLRPALIDAAQTAGDSHAIDDECFRLLRATGAFRALLAPQRGGPPTVAGEADPIAMLDFVEDCAAIRGTLGWIAFVGISGGLFDAELDPDAAAEIYADPDVLVAYAGAPAGTLTPAGDDYTLSGRWSVVSGISHATWIALGARLTGRDTPVVAIVPRTGCTTAFPWEPVGLTGTGTGSVAVDGLRVPYRHVIMSGDDGSAGRYRSRYRTLIPALIGSVSLGIARGGLDAVAAGAAPPGPHSAAGSERLRDATGRAWAQIYAARAFVHDAWATIWRSACDGADPGLEAGARLRLATTHAADVGAEVTTVLVSLAGTAGVTAGHPLAQRWLDARTLTANVTVRALYYRVYGGVRLFGEAPESWP